MTVYVVMGNDFPDAVFATNEAAQVYCAKKRTEPRLGKHGPGIYWRVYSFEVQS